MAVDVGVQVSAGDGYDSWPVLLKQDDTLTLLYGRGTLHGIETGRLVKEQVGTWDDRWVDPPTWSSAASATTIHNSSDDDAVFGIGQDSSGNPLAWIRERSLADAKTWRLKRKTGSSWSTLASPTFTHEPVVIRNIVTSHGYLMAWWHNDDYDFGVVVSDDDGETWTQVAIATAAAAAAAPVEGELLPLADGRLFGIGRTQVTTDGLFQMQLAANGDPTVPGDWTITETNIADQQLTPATFTLRNNADGDPTIGLYYFDRENGVLRYREATVASVWGSPTSWPDADAIAEVTPDIADTGYPAAVYDDNKDVVVFYAGDGDTSIRAVTVKRA